MQSHQHNFVTLSNELILLSYVRTAYRGTYTVPIPGNYYTISRPFNLLHGQIIGLSYGLGCALGRLNPVHCSTANQTLFVASFIECCPPDAAWYKRGNLIQNDK